MPMRCIGYYKNRRNVKIKAFPPGVRGFSPEAVEKNSQDGGGIRAARFKPCPDPWGA